MTGRAVALAHCHREELHFKAIINYTTLNNFLIIRPLLLLLMMTTSMMMMIMMIMIMMMIAAINIISAANSAVTVRALHSLSLTNACTPSEPVWPFAFWCT